MIKTVLIFYTMMLVWKGIYVSGDNNTTVLQSKETNTHIECKPGFNGTISCFETIFPLTTYCTVQCTSSNQTYYYLTSSNLYDNKTIINFVSPVIPIERPVNTKHIKCAEGYNVTKICFSNKINFSYIKLLCEVNCTSNSGYYMYEANMILTHNDTKIYESSRNLSKQYDS